MTAGICGQRAGCELVNLFKLRCHLRTHPPLAGFNSRQRASTDDRSSVRDLSQCSDLGDDIVERPARVQAQLAQRDGAAGVPDDLGDGSRWPATWLIPAHYWRRGGADGEKPVDRKQRRGVGGFDLVAHSCAQRRGEHRRCDIDRFLGGAAGDEFVVKQLVLDQGGWRRC